MRYLTSIAEKLMTAMSGLMSTGKLATLAGAGYPVPPQRHSFKSASYRPELYFVTQRQRLYTGRQCY